MHRNILASTLTAGLLCSPWIQAEPISDYNQTRESLTQERRILRHAYRNADSTAERQKILTLAEQKFANGVAKELAPFWFGTGWDFNGTSTQPGEGNVACGYFVSTVLLHAGIELNRYKVGQMPSQKIIRHLIGQKQEMPIRIKIPLSKFVEMVRRMGPGLYVVGLDYHVGFLYVPWENSGQDVRFIHSNFVKRVGVVDEPAKTSRVLAASKYRVVGKLTASASLMERWLLQP